MKIWCVAGNSRGHMVVVVLVVMKRMDGDGGGYRGGKMKKTN